VLLIGIFFSQAHGPIRKDYCATDQHRRLFIELFFSNPDLKSA